MSRLLTVVIACCACLATALSNAQSDWLKCTADSDCAVIKGACGPAAANKQHVQAAQQRENDLAAMIRADPKGPVQCQGWVDDPYANAKAICHPDPRMCGITYPRDKLPKLKPSS